MQYLVIWSDGNKYGPADLALLNQWAADGRIFPDTELEPVDGSPKIKASMLAGLVIPGTSTTPAPTAPEVTLSEPRIDDGDPVALGAASLDLGSASPKPAVGPADSPVTPTVVVDTPPQYYVLGPGGTKYGPADAPTLVKWKAENRLSDTSELEDAETGQRLMAGSLPGMATAQPAYQPVSPYSQPSQGSPYAQAPQASVAQYGNPEAGKQEFIQSMVAAAVGFFCLCWFIAPGIGVWLGYKAKALGNKNAMVAIIINFVLLGLQLAYILFAVVGNRFGRF